MMKKCLFLITATFFFGLSLSGQNPVVVDSLGNVSIGSSSFVIRPLRIMLDQSEFIGSLIYAEVQGNEPVNDAAIFGRSIPSAGRGIGGLFQGGFQGVRGEVVAENFSYQYEGVVGQVAGGGPGVKNGVRGSSTAVTGGSGVRGEASLGELGSSSFGVNGGAYGQGKNFGVYGVAQNGTENWAGYFDGNTYIKDRLNIGEVDANSPVSIVIHQDSFQSAMFNAEILGNNLIDKIAIQGKSIANDGWGIAGEFEGGYIGVRGKVNPSGAASYFGLIGDVSGGTGSNYSLLGSASGTGTNYGVYGSATGGQNNWGGFFDGDGYFSGKVGIGTTSPADLLHIKGLNASLKIENTTNHSASFVINSGNQLAIANNGNYPILFFANNMEHMRIAANGKVGINTVAVSQAQVHILGPDNDGSASTLRLTSGPQHMLLDGNEIDAFGFGMFLNNNSNENVILANGGGQVGINEAAPQAMLDIKELGNFERAIRIENDINSNSWSFTMNNDDLTFYFGNTQKARISNVNGAWTPLSDKRVKKNINYLSKNFLDRINTLKPASYHYLDNANDARKSIGFIAQDAQEVFPEYIDRNENEMMTLDYNIFTVIAIKSIQELSAQNIQLEKTNNKLEDRVITLEKRLLQLEKLLSTK